MADDNSNDVVMVVEDNEGRRPKEVPSTEIETRPLMQLFQRLTSNDSKQNTVLTNAQIISILHKEFDIDITEFHELELDIYLNTVKRFLKDWPEWDEFDRGINWLRKKKENANKTIKKTLENYYKNLKKYLQVQIDATRPLAKEAVDKIEKETTKKMQQVNTDDIVLEIYCARKQLNELIFNQPNPDSEHNVFHLSEFEPRSISVNRLPLESILNWWGVQVSIEMRSISLTWTTMHQVKHVLVNRKNGPRNLNVVLNENIQIKDQKRSSDYLNKSKIYALFNAILINYQYKDRLKPLLQALFFMIKSDFEMILGDIKVPATYRRHTNKYPYYRKLCKEYPTKLLTPGKPYDLYIEETLSPMHVLYIGKIGTWDKNEVLGLGANNTWLTIECAECKTKFNGIDLRTLMKEHFEVHHANEPDWTCTNCEKKFSMTVLSMNRWKHICD